MMITHHTSLDDGPSGMTVTKAVPPVQDVVMRHCEEVEAQQWSRPSIVVMVSPEVKHRMGVTILCNQPRLNGC